MSMNSIDEDKIYQEEKARDAARKRLKSEENTRKNMKIVYGFIIFFVVYMVIAFFSSTKQPQVHSSSSTSILNEGQIELIDQLHKKGLLRVDAEFNKAYIARSLWNEMDAKLKEDFVAGLAVYCATRKGSNVNWVEIYDKQSAKKLAKYGSAGFEVY